LSLPSSLAGSVLDFTHEQGTDLVSRLDAGCAWGDLRLASGYDSYQKTIVGPVGSLIHAKLRDGSEVSGLNFASQDYLSLSSAPEVRRAAVEAIELYGVHSAGSAALMGLTQLSNELERELAEFTGYADCTVFPIAWAAGYGVITTLVRPGDHVVIDLLAHACLQEGARNATSNVHRVGHLSTVAVERRLKRIRAADPTAGILVVTESIFSMDSDSPDMAELQALCHAYQATLLVDCAHDLGALGRSGLGVLEEQGMVGQVDVLMGSFSKAFGSPGGFVCSNSKSLKWGLRYLCGPSTFTNAMTPLQAAVVRASLSLVRGAEGDARRARLMANVLHFRRRLSALGYRVLGHPSAVIPVVVGDVAFGRVLTKHTLQLGGIVNLVEYPAVSVKSSRWRLQVMADHSIEQIDAFLEIRALAERAARLELAALAPLSLAPAPLAPHEMPSFAPAARSEEAELAPRESGIVPKDPTVPVLETLGLPDSPARRRRHSG
jgi:glycine C-acetyltransferase